MQLAQEREEAAKALLLSLMPKGLRRHEGNGVSVTMGSRKGNVDWRKLFADHGITMTEDQLNKYRRATSDNVTIRDLHGTPKSNNAAAKIRSVNSAMTNQMATVPELPKPSAHDAPVVRDTGREFIF
jgi:hypothetical protein